LIRHYHASEGPL